MKNLFLFCILFIVSCSNPIETKKEIIELQDLPENRKTFVTDWEFTDSTIIIIPFYRLYPKPIVSDFIYIEIISNSKVVYKNKFIFGNKNYIIEWKQSKLIQIAQAYVLVE
jgi:hypothetical protein